MVIINNVWESSDSRNWLQLRIFKRKEKFLLLSNNFYIFLLIFSIQCYLIKSIEGFSSPSIDTNSRSPDTQLISDILNKLTNPSRYDKRLRPMYGKKPVDVGITIHVSSISAVSEVDMDFTLDFYLRQSWRDDRLAFGELDDSFKEIKSLTVGVDYLDKLWKPDTFFPNEKKSFFHTATTHNSFLRIDPDGTVFTSQRLTVTATCPMKLKLFPMDSQKCKLEIESYGYDIKDISYYFQKSGKAEGIGEIGSELPQFVLKSFDVSSKVETLSSGNYSRLSCIFLFRRNIGFYVIQIYLPSILIAVISWISFWLSRESSPSRISLGLLTVLSMTTIMNNSSVPKVSYVKSIDIFLGFSFLSVFASLLEYAAVGYISKRNRLIAQKHQTKLSLSNPMLPKMTSYHLNRPSLLYGHPAYKPFYSSLDRNSNLYDGTRYQGDCYNLLKSPMTLRQSTSYSNIPQQMPLSEALPTKHPKTIGNPSKIDIYSRILFPLTYIVFNIIYWSYYYSISDGYTTADIDYFWGSKRGVEESNIVKFDNFSLPQFKRTAYKLITAKATTSSGSYIRLKVQITFTRQIGFYLMNIIVPSILIVTISWVSFWLDRGSSPARTGLGVTTVLTETTLITTTNNSMPKVSYIKGLDVYLNFCFVMVFASLVEYAVVSYMNKKLAQKRDKKRRKQEQAQTAEMPMFGNYNATPFNNNPTKTLISHPEVPADCDCRTIPMVQPPRFVPDNIMWPAPFIKAKKATRTCRTITPSKIDRCSRSVFPIIFIIFNLGYWTIMTILNAYTTSDISLSWCDFPSINTTGECNKVHKIDEDITLPNFLIMRTCVDKVVATTSSGDYVRLYIMFNFQRSSGYYLIQSLLPAALIVIVSWIAFWISRDSPPSRTSLGVMTVLAMTHLLTGVNRRLPPVNYIKAADIYLGFCYLMVAFSLFEYAAVAFSKRRNENKMRREKKKGKVQYDSVYLKPTLPDPGHDVRLKMLQNFNEENMDHEICTCSQQPVTSLLYLSRKSHKLKPSVKDSHIDRAARIIFPVTFSLFNAIFWSIVYNEIRKSQLEESQMEMMHLCK
uniref:Gamma-aminobutyric acid receptor subunit beta n=1 Tax=Strongyloides papillosus TaxID=174720 RepID=A0A0N5CEA1_STREA